MFKESVFTQDVRKIKHSSGAYEWWYFDAISDNGSTEFVVIFYEGNPFSRRYINCQRNEKEALAANFPAISISVYKNNHPIYYSFTEVRKNNATFDDDVPHVRIEDHAMMGSRESGTLTYRLRLRENLASGDTIDANIVFESSDLSDEMLNLPDGKSERHRWHLIQPWAKVNGYIKCTSKKENKPYYINFKGEGYHDHNVGAEPMKQAFNEWYWGRFHLPEHTFIYYVRGDTVQEKKGWLIENDSQQVVQMFDKVTMEDSAPSLYGLRTERKLTFGNSGSEILVQQSRLLDNGPFYQRFSSDVFFNLSLITGVESSKGITEYLCPPRIHNRLFWPLTNMRIRYKMEEPHWVQRSKTLYRWTW